MTDPFSDLVKLSVAARELPDPPHTSTFIRWSSRGIRGIKLRLVRIGGRHYVSRSALKEFFEALSAAPIGPTNETITASQQARNNVAERELDARFNSAGKKLASIRRARPTS